MRINLLGPLQVDGAPGSVVLRAAKERSLLSTLALSPRAIVPTEVLVRALWGDDPPASARKTLQTYVWNLRQALGAEVITTEPGGYALQVASDDVDVARFRSMVRTADDALRIDDAAQARASLRDALALWRGDPFADVAAHTGLATEAVRLHEERLSALETRIAADLADGAHAEIVGELEVLVREHPFRERLWGDLMVALYRCGRQAEALAAYQRARSVLVDELGLEPGGELRRIEESILRHDPSLAGPRGVAAVATATSAGVLRSPVRYTKTADGVSIAYQVAGEGPVDIIAIPGFVTHLDIWWNAPTDGLVRQLTTIGRLISFDKRGMGLSDRPERLDGLDWVADTLAVLDAVDAKDVVVLGVSAGTPTAIRLAALHPQRVRALVLFGGGPRTFVGPDYDIGHERETVEAFAANLERGWGSGVAITAYAPSRANDPHVRDYWARYQQLSAAPAAAMRSFWAAVETDVTDLLPTIGAPTLVLHPERDLIAPVAWGRFMAEHIPGAEFVALDSDVDLICVSDVIGDMAQEIASFIGRRIPEVPAMHPEPALVTVLAVHTVSAAGRERVAWALERSGGRLQERPSVTAVFDTPGKALRAATMLRNELAVDGPSVLIGVGIDAGECVPTDVGFRGDAVATAHRLAEDAHRHGEILVTGTVRELVTARDLELDPRQQFDGRAVFALI